MSLPRALPEESWVASLLVGVRFFAIAQNDSSEAVFEFSRVLGFLEGGIFKVEFSGEARTFLSIMLTGMIMGCAFDVCRTARNTFKLRTLGTAATDILFWILAVAVVFAVLIAVNRGQIRFYVFIALVVGAAAYFRFFSRSVLVFLLRLVRLINKIKISVQQALRAVFLTIAVKPVRIISPIALKPLQAALRVTKRLCRRLLPPLPPREKPPD